MARYDGGFGRNRGGSFGGRRPTGGYDRNVSAWWGYDRDYGREGTQGPNARWGQERGQGQGGRGGQGDLGYGWGGGRERTYGGQGGGYGAGGQRGGQGGYDRGVYGGEYPQYGGYPGSNRQGMDYGGRYERQQYERQYGQGGPDLRYQPGRGSQGGGGMQGRPNAGTARDSNRYDSGYMGGYSRGYDRRPMGRQVERVVRYGGDFAREPFMPEAAYLRHPEYETPATYHQQRWEQPGRYEISGQEQMGDEEIQQEVRQRLYQDTWLQGDDIEVEVSDGVVTLRGEVGDFLEARYAWDDAWESEGVRGVINNLTVRTNQPGEHHGDMFPQDTGEDGSGSGNG
ncbi:MAG: BON domain-containing protein [Gemmatimonadetes bacterium]|nr:BON domain-containing protein [Gemmatimonadota bacterium]